MQRELVIHLRRVAPQHIQLEKRVTPQKRLVVGRLSAQGVREPERLQQKVVEEHGEPFGHGVVAQAPRLEIRVRRHAREMQGMAELVPEGAVVVVSAPGPDDEVYLIGDAHGGAKRAGTLERAILDVEAHPALRQQIETHRGANPPRR